MKGALAHLSHAYLFVGPAQVGKLTAAVLFAQAINCTDANTPGCGQCRECRAIVAGQHPDVRVWGLAEGEKTFKVERVRELIAAVGYHPYQGRRKVHILAALDAVAAAGANALLKTLEEPPPATTLILVASDLDGVLPTILSRCQLIPFGLTPPEAIAEHLSKRFPLLPEGALAIAHRSQGRVGRAVALASEPPVELPDLSWPTPENWLAWSDGLAALPEAQQRLAIDRMLAWLRDVALLASGLDTEALRHPESATAIADWAGSAPLETWLSRAEELEAAREGLDRHGNAKLVFDRLGQALLR